MFLTCHLRKAQTPGTEPCGKLACQRCNAKAQLRDAEIQLSYTEIKSPIDGRIGRAAFSPGNLVSPEDSGVLATVVSEHPIRVLFPVTQRELLDACRGAGLGGSDNIVVGCAWPTAALQREGQGRLPRRHRRSQDRHAAGPRHLRQQEWSDHRRADGARRHRRREVVDGAGRPAGRLSPRTRPAPMSSRSTTRTQPSSGG